MKKIFILFLRTSTKYVVEARECNLCKTAIPIIPTYSGTFYINYRIIHQ